MSTTTDAEPTIAARPKSIPRAPGHWLLGNARAMRDTPHTFAAELGLRSGGIGRFRILHRPMLAVTHPDYLRHIFVTHADHYERSFHYRTSQVTIGQGLITTDGDYWRSQRRLIQPAFRTEHIRKVVPATARAVEEAVARWSRTETVPLVAEMQTLTMAVMCRALLSVTLESADALRFARAVRDSLYVVRRRNTSMCPMPLWVHNGTNRALHETRDVLDAFVTRHLQPRLQPDAPRHDDIVQQLLDARAPETGERMPWQALLDETKTLFTAGFETTATSLTWALHRLSHAPDVLARLHAELDQVLAGRAPAWEDLPRLTYTHQVAQEALRLYPPVYSMGRACVADDEIDGYRIRSGDTLLASIYGAHLTPEFWPDPHRFDPDRFAPGRAWPKHAFMPFGLGKHLCIGNAFAMTEIVIALALIAQRHTLVPRLPVDIPIRAQITLVPAGEIPVRLIPRSS